MESHYEVLGVSPDADLDEIRAAYRRLLKRYHPDQGGSREQFLRIKRAYETVVGEHPDEWAGDGTIPYGETDRTYDPSTTHPSAEVGLQVTGTVLTVSLVALVHDVTLEELLQKPVPGGGKRTAAFFTVHNTSDRSVTWRGHAQTSFVGDDGFLYQGSNILRPHESALPGRWCGIATPIPPGKALDAVVVAQEIPDDVDVERVVYTQAYVTDDGKRETEQSLFRIRSRVRDSLDELPYGRQ